MIGSRVRASTDVGASDELSDWDFQVVTSQPRLFGTSEWVHSAGLASPLVYVVREGRLGHANKVSIVWPDGILDVVVIASYSLYVLRVLVALNAVGSVPRANQALRDWSLILKAGHSIIKAKRGWRSFLSSVANNIAPARLSNREVIRLADEFVCDYISAVRKVRRGEFMAAQRWLHCHLAETNFRLLHELRMRNGEESFPDARRIEDLPYNVWHKAVSVNATLECNSLIAAIERSAQTCRALMSTLTGGDWQWPRVVP